MFKVIKRCDCSPFKLEADFSRRGHDGFIIICCSQIPEICKEEHKFSQAGRPQGNHAPSSKVDILKRLQRETFSDIMKLRDRQDKFERMLSFYKDGRGALCNDINTRIRGEIDAVTALLLSVDMAGQTPELLAHTGIRTGVRSKFVLESVGRDRDALVAEFTAAQPSAASGNVCPGSLALTKLMYLAKISNMFSLSVLPLGAQSRDLGSCSNSFQVQGLTDYFPSEPSPLNPSHSCAIGMTLQESRYTATLGVLASCHQMGAIDMTHYVNTFAEVTCSPHEGTKLALMGLHQKPVGPGPLAELADRLKFHDCYINHTVEADSLSAFRDTSLVHNVPNGASAVMIKAEIDERFRIGASLQLQRSHLRHIHWKFAMSDSPVDEVGWGLSLGGTDRGLSSWSHFHAEAFLMFKMGKRLSLQPGIVYAGHEKEGVPALMSHVLEKAKTANEKLCTLSCLWVAGSATDIFAAIERILPSLLIFFIAPPPPSSDCII